MQNLTISLIQSSLTWENIDANLKMFGEKIRSISQPTQVIILPEMFSTGFSMKPEILAEKMDGKAMTWMRAISHEKRAIITGSLIIEEEGKYYNRLIWMLPNGQFGHYDKRHLFAFANEHQHYTGGERRFIASVNGWKVNLQVCYDLRFPVWARQSSGTDREDGYEYDLMINVANWPQRRNHAWKTLLNARAIENQCFVVGVNRLGNDGKEIYHSGDSSIINPLGEILYTKADEEDIFTYTLEKSKLDEVRTKLPFNKDKDDFMIKF